MTQEKFLEKIEEPEIFFNENKKYFDQTVKVVREAFGSLMTEEDIYNHLTEPKKVYILKDNEEVFGMYSMTPKDIAGNKIFYVDGIAINPKKQGKGIFKNVTHKVREDENFVALRTQNPCMHRALEKLCGNIYPNIEGNMPEEIESLMKSLSNNLMMPVDNQMVARKFYGKSLYSSITKNKRSSYLFDKILGIDYNAGDSVLCIARLLD